MPTELILTQQSPLIDEQSATANCWQLPEPLKELHLVPTQLILTQQSPLIDEQSATASCWQLPEPLEELHLVPTQLILTQQSPFVHAEPEQSATLWVGQLVLLTLERRQDDLGHVRLLLGADHWTKTGEH